MPMAKHHDIWDYRKYKIVRKNAGYDSALDQRHDNTDIIVLLPIHKLQVAHCKDNHFVYRKVFMEQHSC